MFKFFNAGRNFKPLNHELRIYFEQNFLWLEQEFPHPPIEERRIFTPSKNDFPYEWDGSEALAVQIIEVVAKNMQISIDKLEIDFFDSGLREIDMGNNTLFLEDDPNSPNAAGLYMDSDYGGKYCVAFDRKYFHQPEALIATIAHELAHVKLLGEKRIEENDEYLTDLVTVFFGFGVFNANSCFQFHQSTDRWGYNQLGYLKQEEWSYALALLAFLRGEENPEWSNYLSTTIKKDFEKSLRYLVENEDDIFRVEDG